MQVVRFEIVLASIVAPLLLFPSWAFSSVLPSQYRLPPALEKPEDAEMTEWFQQFLNDTNLSQLTEDDLETILEKLDPIEKKYAQLKWKTAHNINITEDDALNLEKDLKDYNLSNHGFHPLTNYVLDLLSAKLPVSADRSKLTELYSESYVKSCPSKKFLSQEFDAAKSSQFSLDRIKLNLTRLKDYTDTGYKENLLRSSIENLDQKNRTKLVNYFWEAAKDVPNIYKYYTWLVPEKEKTKIRKQFLRSQMREKMAFILRKDDCNRAKVFFTKEIVRLDKSEDLDFAVDIATKIGQCFKSEGGVHRIKSWRSLVPAFSKAFGYEGEVAAKLMVARYLWTEDRFEEAKAEVREVISTSQTKKSDDMQAKARLMLADILDNQEAYGEALREYTDLIERFPKFSEISKAQQAKLLIHVSNKEWKQVESIASQMILAQDELPIDKRDDGSMGFALFWGGRSWLEMDQNDKSIQRLRRLSTEFYSTYYGALGHYLLEQLQGKPFQLPPIYSAKFNSERFFNDFDVEPRQQARVIGSLLRLGLKSEALCEIKELTTTKDKPGQMLVKAMFLHAAGDWLASIKVYNELPRTFRGSLPTGMEKLLFPKRFEDTIKQYATKLGLDPYLVFSLIRQESVFNPKAVSGVGARGLMQLMSRTAHSEAKKLPLAYVSKDKKDELVQSSTNPETMFDIESNVILGTHYLKRLLSQYNSLVMSLSAYNAGPQALARWQKKYATDDILYFIEKIPYQETRAYVKIILRNYFYYKRWYGQPNEELPHFKMVTSYLVKHENKDSKPLKRSL